MAWPGPQDGLGQGGPKLKWAKGRSGSKNDEKVKVLRMEFSIVENLSGLQESIFDLSRGPQVHFGEKSTIWSNFIKFIDFPLFPLFGVPWAAVIYPSRPLFHLSLGPSWPMAHWEASGNQSRPEASLAGQWQFSIF